MRTLKKIEIKGGRLVKKWELGQTKKFLCINFSKLEFVLFLTYGQFPPKSSSNLKFVIRDLRVRGPYAEASNPGISDNESQIWATLSLKLTIGHKSTNYSFEKLINKNCFVWPKLDLFPPRKSRFHLWTGGYQFSVDHGDHSLMSSNHGIWLRAEQNCCYFHFTEDTFGWNWSLLHLPDIWQVICLTIYQWINFNFNGLKLFFEHLVMSQNISIFNINT